MHTAGNKIVSCTLGGGFNKNRRFNLNKAVFVKIVSRYLGYLVAQKDISLKVGSAQVKIAVFKPCKLRGLAVLNDFKRRSLALCKNPQIRYLNFDIARWDFGIL